MLFLAAVTAVREVSGGDVRSIASKALTGWTFVDLKLKQVLKDTKSLVKCISKLKVGEGGVFAVRSDGDHIVCAYVLSCNLLGISPLMITSVLDILGTLDEASQPCSSC